MRGADPGGRGAMPGRDPASAACTAGDMGTAGSSGGGRPLVLLHGWACDRMVWSPLTGALAYDGRIVVLDLPGHGRSGQEPRGWCVSDLAQAVGEALDDLGLREPVLMGHSLGGAVALEVAPRLAGGVAGVIMVDTFLFDYGRLSPAELHRLMLPFRRNLAKAISRMVEEMASGANDRSWVAALAAQMGRTAPEVALAALESLFVWDPTPAFEAIDVPIYWISGRRVDPAARRRYADWIHGEIRLDAGHFPMFEANEAFVGAVRGCLDALSAP